MNNVNNRTINLDIIQDVLERCEHRLHHTIYEVMSPCTPLCATLPGAKYHQVLTPWEDSETDDLDELLSNHSASAWAGEPGTFPLLPFIRRAIAAVKELRGEPEQTH
jgi:hypothetical protein